MKKELIRINIKKFGWSSRREFQKKGKMRIKSKSTEVKNAFLQGCRRNNPIP
jgi:hypothetical protein